MEDGRAIAHVEDIQCERRAAFLHSSRFLPARQITGTNHADYIDIEDDADSMAPR